jgi:hypothetical protein
MRYRGRMFDPRKADRRNPPDRIAALLEYADRVVEESKALCAESAKTLKRRRTDHASNPQTIGPTRFAA